MNIFGNLAIFPGAGIDGQDVPPTTGQTSLRVDPSTSKLQLSNNGGGWMDVNAGNTGKTVVAGTNINVSSDVSGNWVVSTIPSPSFTSLSTTGGATFGNVIQTTQINASGNVVSIGNFNGAGANISGTVTANYLVATDAGNTADLVMSTLSNSGSLDPKFMIKAQRGSVTNAANSTVGRLGLFYDASPRAYLNFYRGSSTTDGYIGLFTNGTQRLLVDKDGAVTMNPTVQASLSILDQTLASTGASRQIAFGANTASNNCAYLTYTHSSLGSSANRLSIGMNPSPNTICLSTNGWVGIRNTSPAGALDVAGECFISNFLTVPKVLGSMKFSNSAGIPTSTTFDFTNSDTASSAALQIAPWVDGRVLVSLTGSGQHQFRGTINSSSNIPFMMVDNNGVQMDYLRLSATSNTVNGAIRYSGNSIQYYDSGAWNTLASLPSGNLTVTGNLIFPNTTSKILATVNGTSNIPIVTINSSSITHDYFVPGPNASSSVDGAIRKSNATADIVDQGVFYPLRPFTGTITISYSLATGLTVVSNANYGSGIHFSFVGASLRATFDNYTASNIIGIAQIGATNASTSFGNINVGCNAYSTFITMDPYYQGGFGSWDALGAFTIRINYMFC